MLASITQQENLPQQEFHDKEVNLYILAGHENMQLWKMCLSAPKKTETFFYIIHLSKWKKAVRYILLRKKTNFLSFPFTLIDESVLSDSVKLVKLYAQKMKLVV